MRIDFTYVLAAFRRNLVDTNTVGSSGALAKGKQRKPENPSEKD
jgi:hypothetical protein